MDDKKNHGYLPIMEILSAAAVTPSGFFIFSDHLFHNQNSMIRSQFIIQGNFTINQTKVDETTSFFQDSSSADQVSTYCSQNRIHCFKCCRINPTDKSCAGLFNHAGNYGIYPLMNYAGQEARSNQ